MTDLPGTDQATERNGTGMEKAGEPKVADAVIVQTISTPARDRGTIPAGRPSTARCARSRTRCCAWAA
jgi:hypothetical protein